MDQVKWTEGRVETNGIQLHYHRTGGDKPPVVLMHGITDNGLCWSRVATALQGDYDLLLVDLRGHGRSDKPAAGYGPQDHADDIAGLIRGLGLKRPAVIGHSMGAASAAELLARYPGLTAGAVLEDPPWRLPENEHKSMTAEAWAQRLVRQKSLSREVLVAEERAAHPEWSEEEFVPWAEAKYQMSEQALQFVSTPKRPWAEVAAEIVDPVLLVRGDPERGGIVDEGVAQEVIRCNPKIVVVHLPGAGHSIRREQFEAYIAAVRGFLEMAL